MCRRRNAGQPVRSKPAGLLDVGDILEQGEILCILDVEADGSIGRIDVEVAAPWGTIVKGFGLTDEIDYKGLPLTAIA